LQGEFLGAALRFLCDEPVEYCLPTDHAIGKFLQESAISRGKLRSGCPRFQRLLNKDALGSVLLEGLDGNLSWFLDLHP
jgi:hypothetical protein